jgi:hypothetical protein
MLRPERCGPVHIQRQSSHAINSQLRWGLRSKHGRPGELAASGAHDPAPKVKRDSVHYGGTPCIHSPPNGSPLRWRHLTEISKSACWTMMVSSIRSHSRVTRTGPIGSTIGVRGTSISSRPIGATGVNSTSRPRKLQDGTCVGAYPERACAGILMSRRALSNHRMGAARGMPEGAGSELCAIAAIRHAPWIFARV